MTYKNDLYLVIHDSNCTQCEPINKTDVQQAAVDVKTKTDGLVQLGSLDAASDPEILRRVSFWTAILSRPYYMLFLTISLSRE